MAVIDELIRERRKKLEAIRKKGLNPYPADSHRTHRITEVVADFEKLSRGVKKLYIVGRIRAFRDQGGVVFVDLQDESGGFQAVLNKKN